MNDTKIKKDSLFQPDLSSMNTYFEQAYRHIFWQWCRQWQSTPPTLPLSPKTLLRKQWEPDCNRSNHTIFFYNYSSISHMIFYPFLNHRNSTCTHLWHKNSYIHFPTRYKQTNSCRICFGRWKREVQPMQLCKEWLGWKLIRSACFWILMAFDILAFLYASFVDKFWYKHKQQNEY